MPVHILPLCHTHGNTPTSPSAASCPSLAGKVDRRTFLSSVAAASLLATSSTTVAATAEEDKASDWFALLADTHIAADSKAVARGQVMARNLEAVIAGILEQPTLPRAAFFNGDLAFLDGQSGDYQTLVELLKPLREAGIPLHLTLGNHDDRDNFRASLGVEAPGSPDLMLKHVAVVPAAGHRFLLLDSLDAVNVTPGKIGTDQLGWISRIIDAEPQVPVIVLVHHNLGANAASLTDQAALLEALRPRRQVKSVLFGHTHVWENQVDESDLHLVNLPAIAYPFASNQPLGWCRLSLTPASASLELHCVGGNRDEDGQRIELPWRAV